MLLKNTGDKIVNVGRDILMPGEEKHFPDGMVGDGALSVLIAKGFLHVSMEDKGKAEKAEPAHETAPSPFAAKEPGDAEPAEGGTDAGPEKEAPAEKKPARKSVKKAE